jgi:hypothetical protein
MYKRQTTDEKWSFNRWVRRAAEIPCDQPARFMQKPKLANQSLLRHRGCVPACRVRLTMVLLFVMDYGEYLELALVTISVLR